MSFWDGVKTVGGAVVQQMNEKQERVSRYKDRYDSLDDPALIKRYKGSTGDAKYACALLLRERGYGSDKND